VASVKRLREREGIELAEVAQRTGLDYDLLDYLERGDYHGATLGTLRQYLLAFEAKLGWTLADSAGPFIASGFSPGDVVDALSEPSSVIETPFLLIHSGMTLLGNRFICRCAPEGSWTNPPQ
jgi:transcriptional regulator with XRE-family HTH domain